MGMFGGKICEHQGYVALDAHEQIIEIVGDASRQIADGLHLAGVD